MKECLQVVLVNYGHFGSESFRLPSVHLCLESICLLTAFQFVYLKIATFELSFLVGFCMMCVHFATFKTKFVIRSHFIMCINQPNLLTCKIKFTNAILFNYYKQLTYCTQANRLKTQVNIRQVKQPIGEITGYRPGIYELLSVL